MRAERLFRKPQQANGILAAGEQDRRAFEFTRHLTHEVDCLGFELSQMIEVMAGHVPNASRNARVACAAQVARDNVGGSFGCLDVKAGGL